MSIANRGLSNGPFSFANVKVRTSYDEKVRKNYERQREIMDSIDLFYGDYRDYDRIDKFKTNFDLLNGRLDVKLYEDPLCFSVDGQEVSFDFQNISHTPLIAQFANAMIGEMLGLPFKAMIKDQTPYKNTMVKQRANKQLKDYMTQMIVAPMRQRILSEMQRRAGQTDIFQLASTPEAQMQLEQEINFQLQNELPRNILEFIEGKVSTPIARGAQMMLDYLVDEFDIRFQVVKGFENAIATGEAYFYAGEYDNGLLYESVNPSFIQFGGGDRENTWSQKADWVKRERWLSYQQTVSRHALHLDEQDLELLDNEIEPIGGFYDGRGFWDRDKEHTKHFMYTYSTDEGFRELANGADYKTAEGRKKLFAAYNYAFHKYGDRYGLNHSDYGIREAHIQWRDLREFWVVKRKMDNGLYREFFLPEHYEPTDKDYDVRKIWKEQAWEGWKLGTYNDAVYVGIRELPNQYKSMFDPSNVDLSYYGQKFNTHDNVTKNMSIVDLGKSAQKNFDMVLASIRQDMATTSGRAFTMFMNLMPDGWEYQDWLDLMRNAGILMLDPTRNSSGVDIQFLKEINLTRMGEIADKIQLLQFYRSQVAMSMFFNDAREGEISQYANTANVEQNAAAVHNKTAFFFEKFRKVVEKSLGGLLNCGRFYYKEHPDQAAIFMDDVALAELLNADLAHYEHFGVKTLNSQEELRKLEIIKRDMLGFIQNGASPEAVMSLIYADTESEVKDIIRTETARMEQQRQEEMAQQRELTMAQIQSDQDMKRQELEMDMQKHQMLLQSQEQRVLWDREKFMMQNDVDQNNVSDIIQKTIIEMQGKMDMHATDTQVKREQMMLQEKLEKAKLINDRRKIRQDANVVKAQTSANKKSTSK